ncbi:NAD(P)H-hydrate dehydratase [Candidatus Gottesmanbacteria bacterium RBG_16_52_11]|uniref:ADP-dependent (S)-NAD(P)H-hydrate dehydratase n=1 Tax=Candidatus Gottesmanbacteria bacterium RBG_16_52_11 TaxID=1798374 RepID=A0A1F5YVC8_9BACT|nr:MAG: NAD(P)H-hydrate dehydratase [Candidatus Gottesmanbacteria bacterium RBG_16_52_11]
MSHLSDSGTATLLVADELLSLYLPPPGSHKGQNGRLLVIGGSHLFHAASLWALTVASRIVDLVHYSSVPENNELVMQAKAEFRNGIVVPRSELESYIREDDCILIGPGMTRDEETKSLTDKLLAGYPDKQWVIDAGALQMMDIDLIPKNAILTPHHGEFELLWSKFGTEVQKSPRRQGYREQAKVRNEAERVSFIAQAFNCIVLLKGPFDIVCSPTANRRIDGGNAGMTKGGTGDVLAGLIAALACKNDPFLAACAGSYANKLAGDELYKTVGPYFNATDLSGQIPRTLAAMTAGKRRV